MPCKRAKFRGFSAAILFALGPIGLPGRAADETPRLETELIAEVRENVGAGAQRPAYRFVPATLLQQGQVIYYTLRITNIGDTFAEGVEVVQRIPANTAYIADSASGPDAVISFSADGGATFAAPERLVAEVDGKTQRAPAAQYTHIRWQLRNALAPGAVALARFQAEFR